MSSKDSAGDKLVASIRKTKAAAASSDKPVKKKVVKKTVKRAARKSVQSSPDAPVNKRADTKSHLMDMFQFGRRVWPD